MARSKKKPAKKTAKAKPAKKAAPKKKAAAKKATPKKSKAAKKPARPKKPAPKKPKPVKETEATNGATADVPAWASEFPPVMQSLVDWVNGGKLAGVDFEMYAGFNEQYKPSDWTSNPATDSELFSFGMDGTGGQVAIWRNDTSKDFDALPIVFLGSEGEVSPLATSLPAFLHTLASGYGPYDLQAGSNESPSPNDEMLAWVKETYPNAELGDPMQLLGAAKETYGNFEQHLMAQVKSS